MLQALGEADVQLRITLSYFVEPNPGERGWQRRHRYQFHSLRFALKRSDEELGDFRARINRAITCEEDALPVAEGGEDNWDLGPIRNKGSIHSDIWRGSAAELARRDYLAIYPVGGWWKEKPDLQRFDRDVQIFPVPLYTGIGCARYLHSHCQRHRDARPDHDWISLAF